MNHQALKGRQCGARFFLSALFSALLGGSIVFAAEIDVSKLPPPATANIEFIRDIQPILEKSCFRCHGPEKPKSRFRLDNRESAVKGGEKGVDIVPGQSAQSPLIHYVARLAKDEEMAMPPDGKGDPLTRDQIGLLRAWIDQGAVYATTNVFPQFTFSTTTIAQFISVQGDKNKFREHFWQREGWAGGAEEFRLIEKLTNDVIFSIEGRGIFDNEDYLLKLRLQKNEVGFFEAGFEQFRRYYDDTGGSYAPFQPSSYSLNRDLHLDTGRAWVDFGLILPDWPKMTLGYEYQYRDGSKSTLEWGEARGTGTPVEKRNIYPGAKDILEATHILKFDLSHEIAGVAIDDQLRAEFYDLRTHRLNGPVPSFGPFVTAPKFENVRDSENQVLAVNSLRLEKSLKDWWFISGGYLYSHADASAAFNEQTLNANGAFTGGNFWNTHAVVLNSETHLFNLNTRLGPWKDLTFSVGLQNEYTHQEGFGRVEFDVGNPNIRLLVRPATLDANLDKSSLQELCGLRYTGIPFTVLFAEARLEQVDIGHFEQQIGGGHDFLRDTDADEQREDLRAGFEISPWRTVSWSTTFRHRERESDFFNRQDVDFGGSPNLGYPGFIRHRNILTDQAETKLALHPASWLKASLSYTIEDTDFDSVTDPIAGITPGGPLRAANVNSHIYGFALSLTPWRRFYLSGNVSYSDSQAEAMHNGVASVAPYRGDIITALGSATLVVDEKTDLTGSYSFSRADYGQQNEAGGLPLGIRYSLHSLQAGLKRRFKSNLTASVQYGFYKYAEPSSGGANDYTAHAILASATWRWP